MKQVTVIFLSLIALVFTSCEKDLVSAPQSNTPKITQLPKVYTTSDLKVSLAYSVEPAVYTGHVIEWHYSDSSKIERSAVPVGTQTHFYPYDGTFYYYALLRDTIKHTVVDSVFGTVIINSGLVSAKILSFSPKDTTLRAGNTILFRVKVDTTNQRRNVLLWDFGDGTKDTTSVLGGAWHTYIQRMDHTVHVTLRDTLGRRSLDSAVGKVHWQIQPLNVTELMNTRYVSVSYFVQLYDCSDSSKHVGTSEYVPNGYNQVLPITWQGDTLKGSLSDSWDIDHSDPNRPNDWYQSHGGRHSSVGGAINKSKDIFLSFGYSGGFSDEYKAQHKWRQESYSRGISVSAIPYEGTVADSIYFYLPLFSAKDKLTSAAHSDRSWETPYPYALTTDGCGVSWVGNPQAYIRLKFYK